MEDQYSMADLRHFLTKTTSSTTTTNTNTHFPPYTYHPPHFPLNPHPTQIDTAGVISTHVTHVLPHEFYPNNNPSGFDDASGGGGGGGSGGGDGGTARWPRQETMTLLEIRGRLDYKFKEALHKGPLWDEVSRIMLEEHGYQRSGKKCREKFDNLYKYYKKTKDGKSGRHDGKHYRFFRQLDALYGGGDPSGSTVGNSPLHHRCRQHPVVQPGDSSFSLSQSSDLVTSSSDDGDGVGVEGDGVKRRRTKRSWKAKIKEVMETQMRKLMEKQEAWLEKMMRALENREEERIRREEEWQRQAIERAERVRKFWANERAWVEARDNALLATLQNLTAGHMPNQEETRGCDHDDHETPNTNDDANDAGLDQWQKSNSDSRFRQQCGSHGNSNEEADKSTFAFNKCVNHNKRLNSKTNVNQVLMGNDVVNDSSCLHFMMGNGGGESSISNAIGTYKLYPI